jgi:hypothetical protein
VAGCRGTSGAIKTITSMVLISIHPFAVRKIVVLLVALLGVSAFCFADPVLMVRRHSREHPRVGLPERTSAFLFTEVAAGTGTGASALREAWPDFRNQPDQCSLEMTGDPANARFWPTISND